MESKRRQILKEREEIWGLKSKPSWLESGDENTKFFQTFAKSREMKDTIWELEDHNNDFVSSLECLESIGKAHFHNLFKMNDHVSIAEVIRLSQIILGFVIP